MAKVSTNIGLDADLKKSAQELFADFGLDLTTAITMFLKQAVREQRIPFEVSMNVPNEETRAAIEEVRQMKENPSLGKSYTDVDEMMKELLA